MTEHYGDPYRPGQVPCQCPACGCDTAVSEVVGICDGCAADTGHLPCDPDCGEVRTPHVGPDGRLL